MMNSENKRAPWLGGWVIAAAAGLIAAAVAHIVGHLTYPQSGFIGAGIFLLVGIILGLYWGPPATIPVKTATAGDGVADDAPTAAPTMAAPAMAAAAEMPVPVMAAPVLAAPIMMEAAPTTSVSGPAAMFTSVDPVPAKPAPAAKPKAAAKALAKASPAKSAVKTTAPKAPRVKKPDGPARLSAPRRGKADDLKEIEGIGPALEKLCNELGFYHFDQIAGWSDADVDWVDANMKTFKGRIVRDKWIAQSKIIITEGLEAFRVRAKTNNY